MNTKLLVNEGRLFSECLDKSKFLRTALMASSVSEEDALRREKVYQKVFSNYTDLKEMAALFSGYTETPLLANQYYNATVTAYATSMAGYLSIERAMDQPIAMLYFLDLIGALDNRSVLPNLGAEDLSKIPSKFTTSTTMVKDTYAYTISLGKKIIPGTLKITLLRGTSILGEIWDDRKSGLISGPGILAANDPPTGSNDINYKTGTLNVYLMNNPTSGDKISVIAAEDIPAVDQTVAYGDGSYPANRFKTDMKHIEVDTLPDMLVGESNLMALASMQKSIGVNAQDVLSAKLLELFTKLINKTLVTTLDANYVGDTTTIDLHTETFYDYRSKIEKFVGDLILVDTDMAKKSEKTIKATAYVAGTKVIDFFRKAVVTGAWVENTSSSYINDLVGTINGIPVLRHENLDDLTGYAVHKTSDGNLAPLIRGIFLPLTNTPTIGNYANPSQIAQGVFYQEGIESIANELVQKFKIELS